MASIGEVNLDSTRIMGLESLNELIEDYPKSGEARFRRAQLNYEMGHFEPAISDINEALSLEPEKLNYTFLKSRILFELNRFGEALDDAELAAGAGLETPFFYVHLAKLYLRVDSLNLAEQYANEAMRMAPNLTEALRINGELQLKTENFGTALSTLSKTLTLEKDNPETYDLIAKVYMKLGKLDSAAKFNEMGFGHGSGKNVGLWYNRAKIMERLGNDEGALQAFKYVVVLSPKETEVYQDLAEVYMRRGDFKLAFASFQKAMDQSPKEKSFYLRAGYCLERLYDYKQAQELYLKAEKIFPDENQFSEGFDRMTNLLERQYRSTTI